MQIMRYWKISLQWNLNSFVVKKDHLLFHKTNTEGYSEPYLTSKMELAVDYFRHSTLCLRCLIVFWIRLCNISVFNICNTGHLKLTNQYITKNSGPAPINWKVHFALLCHGSKVLFFLSTEMDIKHGNEWVPEVHIEPSQTFTMERFWENG